MAESNLVRRLSFWHIWAIGVGAVVGDGIFVLIAQGAQAAGPASVIAYAVGGLLMMIILLPIASLGVGMPKAGSLHSWSSRVLGPGYGTVAGLSYIAMNAVFLGSVAIANGALSNYFFQWTESSQISAVIWALILITLVMTIALIGGEATGRTQLILVGILTVIMAGFALFGGMSGKIEPGNFTPFAPFGMAGFWAAMGMGIYAYIGPLSLLTAGSEVKKITDLPKALIWAFVTFLVLYSTCMIVMLGLVNYSEYDSLSSPFTFAAEFAFGPVSGVVMNLAAWIAAFTCLVGEMFAVSRLLYGMAEEKAVPAWFMKLNNNNVPKNGVLCCWIAGVVLIILGNISVLETFYLELAMIACELGALAWLLSLIAGVRYKQKFPEEWAGLPWKMPFPKVVVPAAFVSWIVIMAALVISDPPSILYTSIAVILMILFYHGYTKKQGHKKTKSE